MSFYRELAVAFGISRDVAKDAMWRRSTISDDAWSLLAGTWIAEKGVMLDAIARAERGCQAEIVAALLAGQAKTVADATKALAGTPVRQDDDRGLNRLIAAWRKATAEERTRFLKFARSKEGRA